MIELDAIIAILIFSFVPPAIKLTGANPYTIGFFRLVIAAFFTFLWWRKKISLKVFLEKDCWQLFLIGVVFFGHWITYFYAIKIGGPSSCVLGMTTYGVQLMLYGSLFLNYKLKAINYYSILVVLLGVFLLLPEINFNNNFVKGLMLGLISASCYSLLPIIHQKMAAKFNYEVRIFSQFLFSLFIFLFFLPKTNWNLTLKDWSGLIFLAFFGTLVAHSLWTKATSKMPTYVSGILYYAITPSALFISHLIFDEKLTIKQLVGAFIIISAAVFNIWSTYDQNRSLKKSITHN